MWTFFARLFDTSGFPPRWKCGPAWNLEPWVGYLHIVSDLATFVAYYAVPCVVVYLVARHHNVKFPRIFYVFLGLIFFSCGTVHLIEAGIFWWPIYRFSALVKLLTAAVSCVGVVVLVKILPKALELKSGEAYRREVSGRQEAEASLEFERNLLHTLMNHLPDAIYFKDRSGRFLRISKALADKFHLADASHAKHKTDSDFFPGGHADRARQDEKDIIETGRSKIGMVTKENWPDGSETWALTTKVPLRNKQGDLIGTFGVSRDITQIKEAEESLRSNQERFELCVRGSNDGIWDWDVQTNDVYYSPRFKELLGFEDQEMDNVFESWRSRLHPKDIDPTLAELTAHLEQRSPYDVEYRLRTKSDGYRWFRARGQALWDDTGSPTRMAGSITDITERKRAEEELRGVANKLALPGEAPSETQSNVRLSRFSLRDMISCGSDIRRMSVDQGDESEFAAGIVQYLRNRMVDDEGQPALALVRLFRTRSLRELDDELSAHVAGLADDIELKADTKCLTLVGTAGDEPEWNDHTKSSGHRAIPLPSVEAVEELPMIAQLIRQFGFSVGGIIGGDGDVLISNFGTGVFHVADAVGSPFIPAQDEFVVPHHIRSVVGFGDVLPSGQLFAVICFSKVAIPSETAILFSHLSLSTRLALLAYEEDASLVESQIVTVDRLIRNYEGVVCSQEAKLDHTMRDLIRALDAAKAASRAKSDFLANMSHEIRTPMNGVIGMTELLANTELSSEQRDFLGMVRHSADSLLHLLNDILDFSKIEAGKLELEAIEFNLGDAIGKTTQTLAVRAAEKGLELTCRVDPKLPDKLIGDPGRLRQIIVNLAGNAVKFTERGEVMVDVGEESRTAEQVCLRISVRDTGIGIPKHKQKVIFDAFSQADESTTREYGGTGLGLAICSQLVDIMEGRIWIESEVGKGTTFHLTAVMGIGEQSSEDSRGLDDLEGTSVLVVDDNATNRRVLVEILSSWKLAPVSVEDGPAALREMERASQDKPYEIVLLDCMMPGMDGFEVAEQIRQNALLQDATLIMISSADRPGDPERCRELGITRHMTKPVIQSQLLDVLLSVSGHARSPMEIATPAEDLSFELPQLKVLLVEDGKINQRVAIGFLELYGHNVTIANNGKEALEALAAETFDIVLMDVQMPEMDGFEATSIIRQREENLGRRTPIIAMTAAAMKGDREHCLQAGMDAYVAKPIAPRELFEVLRRFAPAIGRDQESTPPAAKKQEPTATDQSDQESLDASPRDLDVFDPHVLEDWIPGGREAAKEMAQLLIEECPKLVLEIKQALLNNDAMVVARGAHTMKASVGVFAAKTLIELSRQLEEDARLGDLSKAEQLFADLSSEADRLVDAVRQWTQSE